MIQYTVKVYDNRDKIWLLDGKFHREDGPALEGADGTMEWYLNGQRHREDGPAVEYAYGTKEWFRNGKRMTEQEHKKATTKATCDGKEVVIDGITYVLREKGEDGDDND